MRSALHKLGYRFRLHGKSLPGKPDICLPKYKTVIFVHGCFWHRHIRKEGNLIKDCRDCFMAHTLADEKIRKQGVKTQPVLDLLFKIADFVQDLHKEVRAEVINAYKAYDEYCEIAPHVWDFFLDRNSTELHRLMISEDAQL